MNFDHFECMVYDGIDFMPQSKLFLGFDYSHAVVGYTRGMTRVSCIFTIDGTETRMAPRSRLRLVNDGVEFTNGTEFLPNDNESFTTI